MEHGYTYKYPHPAVTADCVVFGFNGQDLKILLIERGNDPYKGCWAFPGGFMNIDETAEQCAKRELKEETGLDIANITGAVVGNQPFGGARASGTNDKAGSELNLYRWISTRSIKETFCPPTEYGYPFLGADKKK